MKKRNAFLLLGAILMLTVACGSEEFNVIFDTNGGSDIPSQKIVKNEKIERPEDPIKNNDIFIGWYKENTFNTPWNFASDVVTENITLFAKWEEKNTTEENLDLCTVSFNVDGGTAVANQLVQKNAKVLRTFADPVKEGHRFIGWYKENVLETKWDFFLDLVERNITLFAKWEELASFTVTFNYGEKGTSDKTTTLTVYEGEKIDITKIQNFSAFKPEGKELFGYYRVREDWGGYEEDWNFATTTVDANVELYARWIEGAFVVNFEMNGADAMASMAIENGEKIPSFDEPERVGYLFNGWYKDSEFTSLWNFDEETVAQATTLYAKWTKNSSYVVSFESNGGSYIADQEVYKNELIDYRLEPTKKDFQFLGWYADENLNKKWNSNNDVVTRDMVLYAKWKPYFTVIYNTNGGSGVGAIKVLEGRLANKPIDPIKEEEKLVAWYTDNSTFENEWDFSNYTITEDLELYAKWDAGYKIFFDIGENIKSWYIVEPQVVFVGDKLTAVNAPSDVMINDGYEFLGWFTDEGTWKDEWNFEVDEPTGNMTLYAKVSEIPIFNVTIIYDGATEANTVKIEVKRGEKIDPNKIRTSAWNAPSSSHSVELYAKWIEAWTVTFDKNTSQWDSVYKTEAVLDGEHVSKPIDPENTYGGIYNGLWYTDAQMTVEWNFGVDVVTKNITLYAGQGELIEFNSMGGTEVASVFVLKDALIPIPEPPTKAGANFTGWRTERGNQYDFDLSPSDWYYSNILYATWDDEALVCFTFKTEDIEFFLDYIPVKKGSQFTIKTVQQNLEQRRIEEGLTEYSYIYGTLYEDKELTQRWDVTETISQDVTLYMKGMIQYEYSEEHIGSIITYSNIEDVIVPKFVKHKNQETIKIIEAISLFAKRITLPSTATAESIELSLGSVGYYSPELQTVRVEFLTPEDAVATWGEDWNAKIDMNTGKPSGKFYDVEYGYVYP